MALEGRYAHNEAAVSSEYLTNSPVGHPPSRPGTTVNVRRASRS
ncbi:hypothetical protein OK006_9495 [Actinobacteria bacterium OK006]|nr:hypothetical protein OK006_9495 [Actinobacteria bacterium OK006]